MHRQLGDHSHAYSIKHKGSPTQVLYNGRYTMYILFVFGIMQSYTLKSRRYYSNSVALLAIVSEWDVSIFG